MKKNDFITICFIYLFLFGFYDCNWGAKKIFFLLSCFIQPCSPPYMKKNPIDFWPCKLLQSLTNACLQHNYRILFINFYSLCCAYHIFTRVLILVPYSLCLFKRVCCPFSLYTPSPLVHSSVVLLSCHHTQVKHKYPLIYIAYIHFLLEHNFWIICHTELRFSSTPTREFSPGRMYTVPASPVYNLLFNVHGVNPS